MTDLSGLPDEEPGEYSEVFLFVADVDGAEAVPLIKQRTQDGSVMVGPMLAVDRNQLPEMVEIAEKMVAHNGRPLEIVRLSSREHVGWVGASPEELAVEPEPTPVVFCLGGCGQRVFGEVIERGWCRTCVPKDSDLPAG